jgi:hypothetical protein
MKSKGGFPVLDRLIGYGMFSPLSAQVKKAAEGIPAGHGLVPVVI